MNANRATQLRLAVGLHESMGNGPLPPEVSRIVRTYGLWPFVGAICGGATIGCVLVELLNPGYVNGFIMTWISVLAKLWLGGVIIVGGLAIVLSYLVVKLVGSRAPSRPRIGLLRLAVILLVVLSIPVIAWVTRWILMAFALTSLWRICSRAIHYQVTPKS